MPKETHSTRTKQLLEAMGVRLRAHRILKGYETSEEFARAIGTTVTAYRRHERGETAMPIDRLEDTCVKLDVTADYLLFGYERQFAPQRRKTA